MMAYGYPEGALERVQGIEIDILKAICAVCDELSLTWFIDSGTCLGAVRHGGFIPWDDDIDIGMKLEDYRVFCERAPKLLPPEYGLYIHADLPNYPPLFAKVYRKNTRFMEEQMVDAGFESGIFVDVFAYERLDSDEAVAKRQIRTAALWQYVSYLYHTAHPKIPASAPARSLLKVGCVVAHGIIRALLTPQGIERRFDAAFDGGDKRGMWTNIFYPTWGAYADEDLFPVQSVAFEGVMVPAPRNADAFLKTLYGDYMTLPPEESRVAHLPQVLDFGDGVNVMEGA